MEQKENIRKAIDKAKTLAASELEHLAKSDDPENMCFGQYRKNRESLNMKKAWLKFLWRTHRKGIYAVSASAAAVALFVFTYSSLEIKDRPIMPYSGNIAVVQIASNHVDSATVYDMPEVLEDAVEIRTRNIDYSEVKVGKGIRHRVELSDGTVVELNSESRLIYPEKFVSGQPRTVYLSGEAVFDVKKGMDRFVVKTELVDVDVLGTLFNVKSYNNDEMVSVSLLRGSVRVTSESFSELLEPGEKISMNRLTSEYEICQSDVVSDRLWTEDKLYMEDMPVKEIADILERKFDVSFVISEDCKSYRFTGVIPMNQDLNIILKQLRVVSRLEFSVEDSVVTIK